MKLYKSKYKRSFLGVIVSLAAFALCIVIFAFGLQNVFTRSREENFKATKEAIDRAITNCYAIEGRYPSNVDYLVEHYMVIINEEKFRVSFQSIGANIRPTFELVDIQSS